MVLKRIADIFRATIHEGLDQVENPLVMINQYLRDMEAEIQKAKEALIKQMSLQEGFEKQLEEAKRLKNKREKQAQIAFDAGEEDLARKALVEKKHYEHKIEHYQTLHTQTSEQIQALKEQLAEFEEQYELMCERKQALLAKADAAKTQEHLSVSMDRFHADSILKEFQRMENKISEMMIRSKVSRSSHDDTYRSRWSRMEADEEIEKELEALRRERAEKNGTSELG